MKLHLSITLLILFCVFTLTNCKKDDEDICCAYPITLEGSWSLVHIQGGFAGVDDVFENGIVVWYFDTETNTILVENNNIDNTVLYDGLESGTYSYEIVTENETDYLYIESSNFGVLTYSSFQLSIDSNIGADGFLMVFER